MPLSRAVLHATPEHETPSMAANGTASAAAAVLAGRRGGNTRCGACVGRAKIGDEPSIVEICDFLVETLPPMKQSGAVAFVS